MPKSQTKRAIQARKWRVSAREKRRLNTIVTEYVRLKHNEIYEECLNLYDSIAESYSENQNLTKTKEFRELVGDYMQTDEPQVLSGEEDQPANKVAETVIAEEGEPANKTVETTVEENRIEPAAAEESVIEPVVHDEVLTIGDTYVEPGLVFNNYIVQPQPDILSETRNETIGDGYEYDGIDRTEDIEAVVNEIINDLEFAEPDIFNRSTVEDEGIELNFEDETDYVLHDFNIDMDLYDF